jgi:hypothetical protein
MALLYDPLSTSQYTPEMLQGGQGGWTPEEIQQLQQRGITMADLQQLRLLGPQTEANPNAVLLRQLLQSGRGTTAAQAAAPMYGGQQSYFGQMPMIQSGGAWSTMPGGGGGWTTGGGSIGGGGGSTMTWDAMARQYGLSLRDIQQFQQLGYTPDQVGQHFATGAPLTPPAAAQAAPTPQVLSPTAGTQPETRALQQMAQIDPATEALRTQLAQSYLTPLSQAGQPSAAQFQSYLDLYKQIDPQGYAMRQAQGRQVADYVTRVTGQAPTSAQDALAKYQQLDPQGFQRLQQLGTGMSSFLAKAQQQAALGSTLDAATQREVEQATRAGQAARGNVYGTPQLVAEAMARGSAGEARQQQRLANLSGALGQQQSYLGSGLTLGALGQNLYGQGLGQQQGALGLGQSWLQSGQGLGDVSMNLYNQQQAQLRAAQQGALGYLGSGQTPYQTGAGYLNMAQQNAAMAAQGGPQYNPQALGAPAPSYAGAQFPQYGLDIGQQAQNWYNSIGAYGAQSQPGQPNRMGSALGGAGAGALSGAAAGTAVMPGWGTAIGALGGAVLGGLGGYSR